jgi:hypothetical protein
LSYFKGRSKVYLSDEHQLSNITFFFVRTKSMDRLLLALPAGGGGGGGRQRRRLGAGGHAGAG